MRIKRNERVDDVVVTAGDAFRQRDTDDNWSEVPYDEVRNELGLLAPLDALVALRCVSRAQEGGQAVVDGTVTNYILGEVDALRFWETSIRPHYGGSGATLQGPTVSGGARLGPGGSVIPSCTPPAGAPANVSQTGAQPVYQTMKVETWVGLQDGLIRSERMTARVLPPISDPKKMPDPIDLDCVFTFSEVNQPITIIPPPLPEPTVTAAPAVAPQPGAPAPAGPACRDPAGPAERHGRPTGTHPWPLRHRHAQRIPDPGGDPHRADHRPDAEPARASAGR